MDLVVTVDRLAVQIASVLRAWDMPDDHVTVTVDNGPGERTSLRVSWDSHGHVRIEPVGQPVPVHEI